MQREITKKYLDELTYEVIGAAIEVQKIMGRGLLESVYHECMKVELKLRNISFLSEHKILAIFKDHALKVDFRCDLLVENCLIIELKATNEMHPIFEAKLLNYMNLLKIPKGILINFNSSNIFSEGQKTFVNEHYRILKEK